VSLNCVANARLLREGPFKHVWVQPAAGDAGGALGAALAFHHAHTTTPRARDGETDGMRGAFLGPDFSKAEMQSTLEARGLPAEQLSPEALNRRLAERLEAGDVVGFFQGRAEFGPRALGGRSILADARSPEMQQRLNLKIKLRESFRPFAPIVLAERASDYFDLQTVSPYMLFTAPLAAAQRLPATDAGTWNERLHTVRSQLPAITHVDFSARVQTVDRAVNPALHAVLSAFDARTGCPVLVNTSFNVRGEPPVCHPREAIDGFLATGMDALALGPFFIEKRLLPAALLRTAPQRNFAAD
jgi:carbamoyltransferase